MASAVPAPGHRLTSSRRHLLKAMLDVLMVDRMMLSQLQSSLQTAKATTSTTLPPKVPPQAAAAAAAVVSGSGAAAFRVAAVQIL